MFSSAPVLKHSQTVLHPRQDQVSHSYKPTGKIKVLYILIILFLDEIKKNSTALVHKRTILAERPLLVEEVSANFCG
jgi:hypothetical protein